METPLSSNEQEAVVKATDLISLSRAEAMSATLDREEAPLVGTALPYLWHWLYFWPVTAHSLLGEDGHPKKGNFLPDLGLPRRMWAGGRFRFLAPLVIGKSSTRTSRITAVEEKTGRSGRLGFVTVTHEIKSAESIALVEEHDIVYRDLPGPGSVTATPVSAPASCDWLKEIHPNEVLLFRYSALTFNGHRIHYDKPYVQQVEGYPDLVVHGPLIATLLMELLVSHQPGAKVQDFAFKAIRPTFLGNPFSVCGQASADGKVIELWAKDHEGWLTMTARASLE